MADADRPRFTSRRRFLLAGAAFVAAGVYDVTGLLQHKPKDTSAAKDVPAAAQASQELTFPRTATVYLNQARLPPVATLAPQCQPRRYQQRVAAPCSARLLHSAPRGQPPLATARVRQPGRLDVTASAPSSGGRTATPCGSSELRRRAASLVPGWPTPPRASRCTNSRTA